MASNNLSTCAEHLAMASVPKQEWCEPYDLHTALEEGTIFPCLNLTFHKAPSGKCSCKTNCGCDDTTQTDREEAMSSLAVISFAINDLTLYLDTHPTCQKGLALFYQLLEQRLDLLSEFAGDHYPLTQLSVISGDCDQTQYGWAEGPMPWEGVCI